MIYANYMHPEGTLEPHTSITTSSECTPYKYTEMEFKFIPPPPPPPPKRSIREGKRPPPKPKNFVVLFTGDGHIEPLRVEKLHWSKMWSLKFRWLYNKVLNYFKKL